MAGIRDRTVRLNQSATDAVDTYYTILSFRRHTLPYSIYKCLKIGLPSRFLLSEFLLT